MDAGSEEEADGEQGPEGAMSDEPEGESPFMPL
jgi:hypothetical protein